MPEVRFRIPRRLLPYLPVVAAVILGALLGIGISRLLPGPQLKLPGERVSLPPDFYVTPLEKSSGEVLSSTPAVSIAQTVSPAVVGITCTSSSRFFSRTGEESSGSGVIFDADNGYIVTNNHVVEGASSILVTLADGREVTAALVGRDPRTDLAVLKINAPNLVAARFGDSSLLNVGELAVAIGNPMGMRFARSVTAGVISGLNRQLTTDEGSNFSLIQTDAAINPGNSGGALVNARGEVIGINTIKIAMPGFEGMGFAIPINQVKSVIASLVQTQKVVRPALGVRIQGEVTAEGASYYQLPADYGVVVEVHAGSAADKAGIKSGDIIIAVDGTPCRTAADLHGVISGHKVGDEVKVRLIRRRAAGLRWQYEEMEVPVRLGALEK